MKLAIITGRPAFDKPICVGAPIVEEKVKRTYFSYMRGVFGRNYFTNNGPLVQKLETEIARIHGAKYCISVCNATIGQILVLKALNMEGEVILPSFTFISTAHACLWQGLKVVFCDISPKTLTIDIRQAKKLINKKTTGIIGVHVFGNLCDVRALTKLCNKYKLKLIFDAAHAFNCTLGKDPIGIFGDAVILSFHATKFFGTFEGGAILTNDHKLAERLRFLRNFGFSDYDDVDFLGINGKMSESSAAMGLASLPVIDSRADMLKNNRDRYKKELSNIPGMDILSVGRDGRSNHQYMVIFINEKEFGVSRDVLYKILWKENIIARRYFYPGCHNMGSYKTLCPDAYKRLPVTDEVAKKILCLPLNLKSPKKDITTIVNVIKAVNKNSNEVLKWTKNHL